jgi:FMN phosphatase YigB (HAD superfamily)
MQEWRKPRIVISSVSLTGQRSVAVASKYETEANSAVDDSYINAKGAAALGWSVAHLVDPGDALPVEKASQYQIRSLEELREVFGQFFKTE